MLSIISFHFFLIFYFYTSRKQQEAGGIVFIKQFCLAKIIKKSDYIIGDRMKKVLLALWIVGMFLMPMMQVESEKAPYTKDIVLII